MQNTVKYILAKAVIMFFSANMRQTPETQELACTWKNGTLL